MVSNELLLAEDEEALFPKLHGVGKLVWTSSAVCCDVLSMKKVVGEEVDGKEVGAEDTGAEDTGAEETGAEETGTEETGAEVVG